MSPSDDAPKPRRPPHRTSLVERHRIVELHGKGWSDTDIAAELGLSIPAVRTVRIKAGLPVNRVKLKATPEEIAAAIVACKYNMSKAAQEIGISRESISRRLQREHPELYAKCRKLPKAALPINRWWAKVTEQDILRTAHLYPNEARAELGISHTQLCYWRAKLARQGVTFAYHLNCKTRRLAAEAQAANTDAGI